MLDATEFTHDALPGLTGITWANHTFTRFDTEAEATATANAFASAIEGIELRVVPDGDRSLIAIIDHSDDTFFFADALDLL